MIGSRLASAAFAVLLVMAVSACSSTRDAPRGTSPAAGAKPYTVKGVRYVPQADPDYDRIGTASWYGRHFHGRRTASGQRFNMNAMTAAHKTLPMGTKIRVTNLANGRSVMLTINDRGPFARNRIIDVSRRAARELGFLRRGVAKVRVQVIST
jgi:rare lipoprotein A